MSIKQVLVILAVAFGGALGALARFGVSLIWPNGSDARLMWATGEAAFPWTTMLINAVGCLLMGVLVVALKERFTGAPPLLNPLLGTGVLGGFTTFSSYTDDARRLFESDQPGLALAYLALTVACALGGVFAGTACARVALMRRPAATSGGEDE
ncbi:fluoride efflux transporter FluC [Streptomyces sp. NPDC086010]|uniref:fluoride efflux transporter FluC n=1 Tax=Streptomyces sp. NPDC086010 TaxID=3365745 RepID=UPI0037D4867E